MKTIGIIGGLGPDTTAEFYLDIVFSCQKRNHVQRPPLLISSVPLPYAIEQEAIANNLGFEHILPFLLREAQRLEQAGADCIVMPCNSLHVFIEELRKEAGVPVLSIVEETVSFLKKQGYNRVGVVSTSATIQNKLYENAFEQHSLSYETPDNFQQAKMGKIIHDLVMGIQTNKGREELISIINNLSGKNIDCVVLACTDLQLLLPSTASVPIFDTMKIFSAATTEYMLKAE